MIRSRSNGKCRRLKIECSTTHSQAPRKPLNWIAKSWVRALFDLSSRTSGRKTLSVSIYLKRLLWLQHEGLEGRSKGMQGDQ